MADIQLELTTPSALGATDKAVVRRGATDPYTIELVALGGASALEVGTAAGTVAAGDHSHTSTAVTDFTEAAQDAVGAMVDGSLTYVDGTPLLQRSALTGAVTASAGSNATSLGSFTKAQLSAAVSDGDPLYVGDNLAAGNTGEVQYNNAGAMAGATDVEIEGNQLRLPYIADPTTPAASGVKLYGIDFGPGAPAFKLPSGKVHLVQSDLGDFNVHRFTAQPGAATLTLETSLSVTAIGTASASAVAVTSLYQMMPRVEFLVTVAATNAIAGWRHAGNTTRWLRIGNDANAPGGFLLRCIWAPATGGTVATNRAFAGVSAWTAAPTDVEPSTRTDVVGMGWDAADANIQFMHNDGAGTCTKIDLGSSFPVPTTDRPAPYELQLYSPNSATQSVFYRVIRYNSNLKTIAAEATGTVTTNLPAVTTLLGAVGAISVGGTSSVIGAALMGILVAREY